MQFKRIVPKEKLNNLIECFWIAESEDSSPRIHKIIPDGFPEIIFHFGDHYRIRMQNTWGLQPKNLLAGQISGYFHLENTGRSNLLGIKFKPPALTHLFGLEMSALTDTVVTLNSKLPQLDKCTDQLKIINSNEERIEFLQDELTKMSSLIASRTPIDKAIEIIFNQCGNISVAAICEAAAVTERQLERLFKKYIGLSPKLYARIIRFSYIFQIVQERKMSWSELGLEAGFYDQSHFIKNFKAFTGEDPSQYFFDQPTLANFFLRK